jgi:hypothetical protein
MGSVGAIERSEKAGGELHMGLKAGARATSYLELDEDECGVTEAAFVGRGTRRQRALATNWEMVALATLGSWSAGQISRAASYAPRVPIKRRDLTCSVESIRSRV